MIGSFVTGGSKFYSFILGSTVSLNNGGTTKPTMKLPDETDESSSLYFYFGWNNFNGSWLIRRQTRSDSSILEATISNNSSHSDLTSSWSSRTSLVYA